MVPAMTAQRMTRQTHRCRAPKEQSRAGGLHQDHAGEQDEVRQVPEVQETEKHVSSSYRQAPCLGYNRSATVTGATIRKCL